MIYTVFKILSENNKQLLLVQDKSTDTFQICVYDEHTGNTLMRMSTPSVTEFERAISIIKE
jgi:hypothetical protein